MKSFSWKTEGKTEEGTNGCAKNGGQIWKNFWWKVSNVLKKPFPNESVNRDRLRKIKRNLSDSFFVLMSVRLFPNRGSLLLRRTMRKYILFHICFVSFWIMLLMRDIFGFSENDFHMADACKEDYLNGIVFDMHLVNFVLVQLFGNETDSL